MAFRFQTLPVQAHRPAIVTSLWLETSSKKTKKKQKNVGPRPDVGRQGIPRAVG